MWPKWLRALVGAWIALDSRDRQGISYFWIAVCVFLGPLLLPFYLTFRPLKPQEKRTGGLWWNLFWNFETLFSALLGLAGVAAGVENFLESESADHSLVRRAEMKAGTILGMAVSLALYLLSRIVVAAVKSGFQDNR